MSLLIQVRTIYHSDFSPILNFVDEPPSLNLLLSILTDLGLVYPAIIILAAVLLLLSGFIAASESAFFSISEDQVEKLKRSTKAKSTIRLLHQRPLLFATNKLLSTMVRIGMVTIFALILLDESGTKLAAGLAIVYLTFVIALFADLIPKIYAKRFALTVAQVTSNGWSLVLTICKPIILHLVELKPIAKQDLSEAEIESVGFNNALINSSDNKGTLDRKNEILTSITNFSRLTVNQVMRNRLEIAAVDSSSSFTGIINFVKKSGFSRIPVCRESVDTIEGILYIKDLLPFLDYPDNFRWQSLMRPGFFVRENRKIDSLLKDFQEKRVHMAIVVDDHGKTIGLVTLEDLIQEIIGEINNESDEELFTKTKEGDTFVFDGSISLDEFCATLEIDRQILHRVNVESITLIDFILGLNQNFSKTGDQINYEQLTFVLESGDNKGARKVRVKVHEQA